MKAICPSDEFIAWTRETHSRTFTLPTDATGNTGSTSFGRFTTAGFNSRDNRPIAACIQCDLTQRGFDPGERMTLVAERRQVFSRNVVTVWPDPSSLFPQPPHASHACYTPASFELIIEPNSATSSFGFSGVPSCRPCDDTQFFARGTGCAAIPRRSPRRVGERMVACERQYRDDGTAFQIAAGDRLMPSAVRTICLCRRSRSANDKTSYQTRTAESFAK